MDWLRGAVIVQRKLMRSGEDPSKLEDTTQMILETPPRTKQQRRRADVEPVTPPLTPESVEDDRLSPPPALRLPKPSHSCQPLQRHQSGPALDINGHFPRRSIFARNVWRQEASSRQIEQHEAGDKAPTAATNLDSHEIQRLVRPPPERLLNKPHFVQLDQLPQHSAATSNVLPDPLKRFYEQGLRTQMGGVYPLVSPPPILRQTSYKRLVASACEEDPASLANTHDFSSLSSSALLASFNLSDTMHERSKVRHRMNKNAETTSNSASSSSSCSIGSGDFHLHKVRFDPRVTVTEFEDGEPRFWFSDSELDRMQWETIHLVRMYLLANPVAMEEFNKPRVNPITNTLQRKPLFAVPVLRANSEEDTLLQNRKLAEERAQCHVRRILVAARNQLVLDLLRRSLQSIFSRAEITTASTGEDTLRLLRSARVTGRGSHQQRGFDVVVVDGRLNRSLHSHALSLDRFEMDAAIAGSLPRKATSLDDLSRAPPSLDLLKYPSTSDRCVALLFTRIAQLMTLDQEQSCDGLVIGVTTTPEIEGKVMLENGASLVWGVPPPPMDERLRDEIVSLLEEKRRCPQTSD